MASSFSASTTFVPYVPRASKPKPKPKPKPNAEKARPIATAKAVDHSHLGEDSSKVDGEFDFSMLDSDASLAALFEATNTPDSVGHGMADCLGATSESERLECDRAGRGSPDKGGGVNASRAVKTNLAVNGLLDGSSRESPLIIGSDAAEEEDDSTRFVNPSNGAPSFHEADYHATTCNEEYHARQSSDLVAVGARAFPVEVTEDTRDEGSLLEVGMTEGPSAAYKRACPSYTDTAVLSPAAVSDVAPELELESPHSAKRRRLVERQAECPMPDLAFTPKSTLLPSPVQLVTDGKDDGARNQVLPPSELRDKEDGDAYIPERVEEPLQSWRRSISPSGEAVGERDIDCNSDMSEVNRQDSSSKLGESLEDDVHRIDKVPRKYQAKSSRRRKRRDRASRQQKPKPGTNSAKICLPRAHSLETKARDEIDVENTVRFMKSFQIADLTLYPIPKGPTIVEATIHYRGSNLSLDCAALEHELLGGEGTIIRIAQPSVGLWTLLGYRHDGASRFCLYESSTFLKVDQRNSHDDAANHLTDISDDDRDEESEDKEDTGQYKPPILDNRQGFSGDDTRYRQRTREPWLESDEMRLLSYRDTMGMEWKEICGRFPDRSPGAVKLRYHMLHRRNS